LPARVRTERSPSSTSSPADVGPVPKIAGLIPGQTKPPRAWWSGTLHRCESRFSGSTVWASPRNARPPLDAPTRPGPLRLISSPRLVSPLRRYSRGPTLVSMRDVQAHTTRYYHFDHEGTTQCLTDESGAVTDRFASDAWGVQVRRTGSTMNPL
jgi:hypothetical protein